MRPSRRPERPAWTGLGQAARVISCAALIMASVFFAFLLSSSVVVKMLALGLGASVIIDATLIRLLIVPSLMFVFDRANWWMPAWLDRVVPRLEAEPAPVAESAHTSLLDADSAGSDLVTSATTHAGGGRQQN